MVIVHDGCGNGGSGGDDGGCDGESPGDSCGDHNASNRFESSADMNAKPWPKPPPRVHVTAGERVHRLQVGRRAPLESGCCCGWLAPTLASPLCFVCVRATCVRRGRAVVLRFATLSLTGCVCVLSRVLLRLFFSASGLAQDAAHEPETAAIGAPTHSLRTIRIQ